MNMSKSIVFFGASGAVGSVALEKTLSFSDIDKLLLIGRRKLKLNEKANLSQQIVDITDSTSYEDCIHGFDTAICPWVLANLQR